jgi:hypothetical protein
MSPGTPNSSQASQTRDCTGCTAGQAIADGARAFRRRCCIGTWIAVFLLVFPTGNWAYALWLFAAYTPPGYVVMAASHSDKAYWITIALGWAYYGGLTWLTLRMSGQRRFWYFYTFFCGSLVLITAMFLLMRFGRQ